MTYDESAEQQAFFRRAAYRKYGDGSLRRVLFAVPNAGTAGGRRAMLAGVRRKAEGVTAGVFDVECLVAMPPYTGWHVEFKRRDGKPSDVTQPQREWRAIAEQYGRKCDIAYGAEDGWRKLCIYLQISP